MIAVRVGLLCCACVLSLTLYGCGDSPLVTAPVPDSDGGSDLPVDDDTSPTDSGGPTQPPEGPQSNDDPTELNLGPEGDSGLIVNARRFPLNAALGDIWGVQRDHYNVDFTLTNGKFLVTPTVVNGATHNLLVPVKATAVLFAKLYSPGDSLIYSTYSYTALDAASGVLAGNAFFNQAYVSVDLNSNDRVDDDEKFDVVGGTIEFGGVLPDIELRFSITLNNGQMVVGHYVGLFDFADRQ